MTPVPVRSARHSDDLRLALARAVVASGHRVLATYVRRAWSVLQREESKQVLRAGRQRHPLLSYEQRESLEQAQRDVLLYFCAHRSPRATPRYRSERPTVDTIRDRARERYRELLTCAVIAASRERHRACVQQLFQPALHGRVHRADRGHRRRGACCEPMVEKIRTRRRVRLSAFQPRTHDHAAAVFLGWLVHESEECAEPCHRGVAARVCAIVNARHGNAAVTPGDG